MDTLPEGVNQTFDDNKLTLGHIEITVTERCSLKCKNCCNLMQYFKNPKDIPANQVCKDISILFEIVDYARLVTVVGGEPFLYQELSIVLKQLFRYRKKIGKVAVITNGTIIPKMEVINALRRTKTVVNISDYRELSSRKDTLYTALRNNSVICNILEVEWFDIAMITEKMSDSEAQEIFLNCGMNCRTVKDGRLYYCPFLAHAESLQVYPYDKGNHLALDENLKKEEIYQYLSSNKAFSGCSYCNGNNLDKPLKCAVQIEKPLDYNITKDEIGE